MRAVLAPLAKARTQSPPLRETYDLVAEVWKASAVAPDQADRAVVEEGAGFFPRRAEVWREALAVGK